MTKFVYYPDVWETTIVVSSSDSCKELLPRNRARQDREDICTVTKICQKLSDYAERWIWFYSPQLNEAQQKRLQSRKLVATDISIHTKWKTSDDLSNGNEFYRNWTRNVDFSPQRGWNCTTFSKPPTTIQICILTGEFTFYAIYFETAFSIFLLICQPVSYQHTHSSTPLNAFWFWICSNLEPLSSKGHMPCLSFGTVYDCLLVSSF